VQRTGLPQHGVDEGRLAVVDVCDDGDISESGLLTHVVDCRSEGPGLRNRRPRLPDSTAMKLSKLAAAKPKKKCCRSKPRCKRCPVVLHKLQKAEHNGIRGKELERIYNRARKA